MKKSRRRRMTDGEDPNVEDGDEELKEGDEEGEEEGEEEPEAESAAVAEPEPVVAAEPEHPVAVGAINYGSSHSGNKTINGVTQPVVNHTVTAQQTGYAKYQVVQRDGVGWLSLKANNMTPPGETGYWDFWE